ncbi:uncharacterized protein [Anser cygnoides]|uniref:uncharacterized protein isoform X1 n=1 Tax=Anser cygnoides TaxID=8845 RepID=UPI0034D2BC53
MGGGTQAVPPPPKEVAMSFLLFAVTALHVFVLVLLFVATLDKAWWVLPDGQAVNVWYDCVLQNSTGGWLCASVSDSPWLRAVQALLVLALLLSSGAFALFVWQLHAAPRGRLFAASGGPSCWPARRCWRRRCCSRCGGPAWRGAGAPRGPLRALLRPRLAQRRPGPGQRRHLRVPAQTGLRGHQGHRGHASPMVPPMMPPMMSPMTSPMASPAKSPMAPPMVSPVASPMAPAQPMTSPMTSLMTSLMASSVASLMTSPTPSPTSPVWSMTSLMTSPMTSPHHQRGR